MDKLARSRRVELESSYLKGRDWWRQSLRAMSSIRNVNAERENMRL